LYCCVTFFYFPQCAGNIRLTKTKLQPLKMILSKRVGSRYQMDLIEMPPYQDYRYILHVVDHLSQYGFVTPLAHRSSKEVATSLLAILSCAIMPDILQSDNWGEVSELGIVHSYSLLIKTHTFYYIVLVHCMYLVSRTLH
jgi:hypothetical protein